MFTISKTLDYTGLAIANENLILSMDHLVQGNYYKDHDGFRFLRNREIYVSNYFMSLPDCRIHCSRYDADMISDMTGFYDTSNEFSPTRMWIKPNVSISQEDGQTQYSLKLDQTEIFPVNNIGVGKLPRIFHLHNNERTEIYGINALYDYYNSNSRTYWSTSHHNLWVSVSNMGEVFIYIPISDTRLQTYDYHAQCGCERHPSISAKIYADIRSDYQAFTLINRDLDIGIEPSRFSTHENSGSLMHLLHPYLQENSVIKKQAGNSYIHISQISSLLPQDISHEALVHPMLFLGAKKFGPSFAGALLTKTLKYIKDTHGAVVLSNIWKHPDHSSEFFDTGLTMDNQNNISLIIHFADLDQFQRNVSRDLFLADKLMKNLSITNQEFYAFLKQDVDSLLLHMAADTILEPIDYTAPVLAVITKGRSFYNAQFYITTFSSSQYITKYIANGLPTSQEDGMLRSLNIPNSFVAEGSSHTFKFSENQTQAKDVCINAFMGQDFSQLADKCDSHIFSQHKLLVLQTLINTRLMLARGRSETLKIMCPHAAPYFHTMMSDILIFISPHDCDINLISDTGIFVVDKLDHFLQLRLQPSLLFHYDLGHSSTDNFYQWLIIIILSCTTALFLILIVFVSFLFYKYRITGTLISPDETLISADLSTQTIVDINDSPTQQETKC